VSKTLQYLIPLFLLMAPCVAAADAEIDEREVLEREQQQAFRDGMSAIVGSLNSGSYALFTNAINKDEFLERIFGLRFIDGGIKRDLRKDMLSPFS